MSNLEDLNSDNIEYYLNPTEIELYTENSENISNKRAKIINSRINYIQNYLKKGNEKGHLIVLNMKHREYVKSRSSSFDSNISRHESYDFNSMEYRPVTSEISYKDALIGACVY